MKVVLLEDIKGLGVRGDVCIVSGGYAMNFLIPNRKAVSAPEGAAVVREKQDRELRRTAEDAERQDAFGALPDTLTLKVQANEKGVLFSAVTAATVVEHLEKQGVSASAGWFPEVNIKETGEHPVIARHGGQEKEIRVIIEV